MEFKASPYAAFFTFGYSSYTLKILQGRKEIGSSISHVKPEPNFVINFTRKIEDTFGSFIIDETENLKKNSFLREKFDDLYQQVEYRLLKYKQTSGSYTMSSFDMSGILNIDGTTHKYTIAKRKKPILEVIASSPEALLKEIQKELRPITTKLDFEQKKIEKLISSLQELSKQIIHNASEIKKQIFGK